MEIKLVGINDGPTGWLIDMMIKEGRRTVGKIQFIGSDISQDYMSHPNLHYWNFATREEKQLGGKAKETYNVILPELIEAPLGYLVSFMDDREKKVITLSSGKIVVKGGSVIIANSKSGYAYKATLDAIVRVERDEEYDPWVKVKLKRPA